MRQFNDVVLQPVTATRPAGTGGCLCNALLSCTPVRVLPGFSMGGVYHVGFSPLAWCCVSLPKTCVPSISTMSTIVQLPVPLPHGAQASLQPSQQVLKGLQLTAAHFQTGSTAVQACVT
jgi:hypothetical protein